MLVELHKLGADLLKPAQADVRMGLNNMNSRIFSKELVATICTKCLTWANTFMGAVLFSLVKKTSLVLQRVSRPMRLGGGRFSVETSCHVYGSKNFSLFPGLSMNMM